MLAFNCIVKISDIDPPMRDVNAPLAVWHRCLNQNSTVAAKATCHAVVGVVSSIPPFTRFCDTQEFAVIPMNPVFGSI